MRLEIFLELHPLIRYSFQGVYFSWIVLHCFTLNPYPCSHVVTLNAYISVNSQPIFILLGALARTWRQLATRLSMLETVEKRFRYEPNLRPTRFTKHTLSNRSESAVIHVRTLRKHSCERRRFRLSKTGLLLKIGSEMAEMQAVKVYVKKIK